MVAREERSESYGTFVTLTQTSGDPRIRDLDRNHRSHGQRANDGRTTGRQRAAMTKAAPFPIPEEELYGSVVNGRFYVLGGFGIGGMAPGLVFEYDPASDRWTRKKD